MREVRSYHLKLKDEARELHGFNNDRSMQGPEGCVSSIFSSCLEMLFNCLESILRDFPQVADSFSPVVLSTKPNESFFSAVREKQLTPGCLNFCFIFPRLVTEHVKRCSGNKYFIYYTGNKDNLYEKLRSHSYKNILVPHIPKTPEVKISAEERRLIYDYKTRFLQGVRQNSVRNQNTKHRPGTMPYEAYSTAPPQSIPVDFSSFLLNPTPPEPEPHPPITVMYTKSTLLSVRCDQMSDVSIAQPIEDVKLGETSFNAKSYTNELDNPLSLVMVGIQSVKSEDVIREVQINSLQLLSEKEYSELFISDTVDHLSQTEQEEIDAEVMNVINQSLSSSEPTDSTSDSTRRSSRRTRNLPTRMRDDDFIFYYTD